MSSRPEVCDFTLFLHISATYFTLRDCIFMNRTHMFEQTMKFLAIFSNRCKCNWHFSEHPDILVPVHYKERLPKNHYF